MLFSFSSGYVNFLKALAESVKGKTLSELNKNEVDATPLIKTLKEWLVKMREVWLAVKHIGVDAGH